MTEHFPCWDRVTGEDRDRHDYGEGGTDPYCGYCDYEIPLCETSVQHFSYEYGPFWDGCDNPVTWMVVLQRAVPLLLCDHHKRGLDNDAARQLRLGIRSVEPYDPEIADRFGSEYRECWENLCDRSSCPSFDTERCAQ